MSGCQSGNIYWRGIQGQKELRQASSMCRVEGESIECIEASPVNPELLAFGTGEGAVGLVNSAKVSSRNVAFKKGSKSVKTDMREVDLDVKQPLHADLVTAVRWTSANRFATASLDHNLRINDTESLKECWNVYLKDLVPTCLEYQPKSASLLSGFEDGYIRLFDERDKSKKASSLFKSHSKWVSRISFLDSDPNIFATVRSL